MSLATGASCRPPPPPTRSCALTMKPARKDAGMYACVYRTASAFPSILWPRRASANNREENPTGHDDSLSTKGRDVHRCPSRQQDRENRPPRARGSHVLCLFNSASPHLGDWIQSFHNGHVTCAKKKYGLKKLGTWRVALRGEERTNLVARLNYFKIHSKLMGNGRWIYMTFSSTVEKKHTL